MRTAVDFGERGIRMNCTSPGTTKTPMGDQFDQMPGNEVSDVFTGGMGRRADQANRPGPSSSSTVTPRPLLPGQWKWRERG
jgi:NAD(P)-dependent dehydrogenase (short-subunit alcohol dehydrogenase family)